MSARRLASPILVAMLLVLGCRPRVFSDTASIDVQGTAPPPVVVEAPVPTRIELREKIQFAKSSHEILEVSHPVLDEAAAQILGEPRIKHVRVEGHASAEGHDGRNLSLSARRAEAVRLYLVRKGVPESKISAEGFGETRPVADNDTPEGREANRRVEINVVEQEAGSAPDAAP